jgi:hypothetical protein
VSEQSPEDRATAGEARMSESESRLDAVEDLGEDSPITQAILATVNAAIKDALRWRNVAMIGMAIGLVISLVAGGYSLYQHVTHPYTNQLQFQVNSLKGYTDTQVRHECEALDLLTATPVSPPSDPVKNQSRETTYKFYEALLYWEHADGCTVVKVK